MNSDSKAISELQIIVNATQLFQKEITKENQEELLDKYVELINPDGFGSPFGYPNKDQLSEIYEGGEMLWTIKTLKQAEGELEGEDSYEALLELMEQKIDPNKSKGFFKEGNPLLVNPKNQIVGQVIDDGSVKDKDLEDYVLQFHITKGDEFKYTLTIDPKLQIRKKGIGNY